MASIRERHGGTGDIPKALLEDKRRPGTSTGDKHSLCQKLESATGLGGPSSREACGPRPAGPRGSSWGRLSDCSRGTTEPAPRTRCLPLIRLSLRLRTERPAHRRMEPEGVVMSALAGLRCSCSRGHGFTRRSSPGACRLLSPSPSFRRLKATLAPPLWGDRTVSVAGGRLGHPVSPAVLRGARGNGCEWTQHLPGRQVADAASAERFRGARPRPLPVAFSHQEHLFRFGARV